MSGLGELEFAKELRAGMCAGVLSGKHPESFLFGAVGIVHVFVKCLIKFDI